MKFAWKVFAGPLLFFLVLFLPLPVSEQAHRLAAIMAWVTSWWVFHTVPLSISGIFGVSLAVLLGVAPAKEAFLQFSHKLVFLLIGVFLISHALEKHRVNRNILSWFWKRPFFAHRPKALLMALLACTGFLTWWLSNTATTAIMMPLLLSLASKLTSTDTGFSHKEGPLVLSTAYVASIAGIGFPIGANPNLICMGMLDQMAGIKISFAEWMLFAMPVSLILFLVLLLKVIPRMKFENISFITLQKEEVWSRGSSSTIFCLLLTILLWLLPTLTGYIFGKEHFFFLWVDQYLPESIAALIPACLLFLLPAENNERCLETQALTSIDWNVIFLVGSGLALGGMLFSTGLAEFIGNVVSTTFGGDHSFILFVISFTLLALVFTEFASNSATASLLIPTVIAAALKFGYPPFIPTVAVAMASSLGFILPAGTPPNAIAFGTGKVKISEMIRYGFLFDIIAVVVVLGVLLAYAKFILN